MLGVIFLLLRVLLALVLYLFLAWALRLIWLDLRQQARVAVAPQIPMLSLKPASEESLKTFHSNSAEMTVGRDPACDCCLTDKTISGQHARLSYRMAQWWVEDLQSTNGTYLNGQTVTGPLVLASEDLLRFGQISFTVTIDDVMIVDQDQNDATR